MLVFFWQHIFLYLLLFYFYHCHLLNSYVILFNSTNSFNIFPTNSSSIRLVTLLFFLLEAVFTAQNVKYQISSEYLLRFLHQYLLFLRRHWIYLYLYKVILLFRYIFRFYVIIPVSIVLLTSNIDKLKETGLFVNICIFLSFSLLINFLKRTSLYDNLVLIRKSFSFFLL